MADMDYSRSVVGNLRLPLGGPNLAAQRTFLDDLAAAIELRDNPSLSGFRFAPYVSPVFGRVESTAAFAYPSSPLSFSPERSTVSFRVRVRDLEGNSSETFYGVPLLLGKKVSLAESGLLERKISTVRVGENTKEDDELLQILRKLSPEFGIRSQDRDVCLSWGEILAAYEIEGAPCFDPAVVQQASVLIPSRSEAYTTEAEIVVTHYGQETEMRCFAYGVGENLYRGRPIITGGALGDSARRPLPEINESGKDAYFTVDRISRVGDSTGEVKWGNLVVASLPLVGQRRVNLPPVRAEVSPFMRNLGMSNVRGSSGGSVDYAALGIGRETGTGSKLVAGTFDKERPTALLDIRLLTITPENLERPESLTELFS